MVLPIEQPYPGIENPVTLRPGGALPGAGAYDAAPVEIKVAGFEWLRLYCTYTQGAAGGAVDLKIEYSPYSVNQVGENWFQVGAYEAGTAAAGSDTNSLIQRELITYESTGAGAENFAYGPLRLNGVERLRIACKESGAAGTPGTLHMVGVLGG